MELYEKVNRGEVRVLIGTLAKLGTGVNVQERLFAVHEVDVPDKPSELEQGEGRMLRTGNIYYELGKAVRIYRYVTKSSSDSFSGDAYNWQMIERKSKQISSVMRGDKTIRSYDETGDDAGLLKAIALNNPRYFDKVKLEQTLSQINASRKSFYRNKLKAQSNLASDQKRLSWSQKTVRDYANFVKPKLDKAENIDFTIIIGKKAYTKRADANEALAKAIKSASIKAASSSKPILVAEYKNMRLMAKSNVHSITDTDITFYLDVSDYRSDFQSALYGFADYIDFVQVMNNDIKSFPERIVELEGKIKQLESNINTYIELQDKVFDKEAEWLDIQKQIKEIDKELGIGESTIQGQQGSDEDGDTDSTLETKKETKPKNSGSRSSSGTQSRTATAKSDMLTGTSVPAKSGNQQSGVDPQYQGEPDGIGIVAPGFGGTSRKVDPKMGYQFDNPDRETLFSQDYGLKKEPAITKTIGHLEELWNMATRTYKEIPENDPYYAEAVHIIGQVQNIAGISRS